MDGFGTGWLDPKCDCETAHPTEQRKRRRRKRREEEEVFNKSATYQAATRTDR
jgi:hypothetical protein